MTDQLIAELNAYEGHAYAVTFSPDGHRLLVGGFGGLIRVYDTTSWQEVRSIRSPREEHQPHRFRPGWRNLCRLIVRPHNHHLEIRR